MNQLDNNKTVVPANVSETELIELLKDTVQVLADLQVQGLTSGAAAFESDQLAMGIEFWKWMDRNYSNSGIFSSNESMREYIRCSQGKKEWFLKQIQGKGYEWDWTQKRRWDFRNLFKQYQAGDVPTRPGTDVTETNIMNGMSKQYQMKAYTSTTNPDLSKTPQDAKVVVPAEKREIVSSRGFQVEEFQNADDILKTRDKRMSDVENGIARPAYTIRNVACVAAKAGMFGFVIGAGTDMLKYYKAWRSNQITDQKYIQEILKGGGSAGTNAAATSVLMVPVSAAVVTAGLSGFVTIPIAIVLNTALDQVIAPCFGRGNYMRYLNQAHYYQNFDAAYDELVESMDRAAQEYENFLHAIVQHHLQYKELQERSAATDDYLHELLNKI